MNEKVKRKLKIKIDFFDRDFIKKRNKIYEKGCEKL